MSPSHVLEPTYEALRQRLLSGAWPPGFRLEATRLADALGVSMTPVRDSLNRLVGERLVHALAGEGFRVPRLDETEIRTLLSWQEHLLETALQRAPSASSVPASRDDSIGSAGRTAQLFYAIAEHTGDPELRWAVENTSARLSPYRQREDAVLTAVSAELDALEAAWRSDASDGLGALLRSYHVRRRDKAGELAHRARLG